MPTDEEVTNDLQENFQNDYDVLVRTLELDHLDVLIGNPPDVLFLDASTTESEGYAILREIRRTPNMEGINIFIIGSSTESERKISEVFVAVALSNKTSALPTHVPWLLTSKAPPETWSHASQVLASR